VLDWLNAGQALQRVLLTLTAHGYHASFLNQPLEVPPLRRGRRRAGRAYGLPADHSAYRARRSRARVHPVVP
jgi:hypothetical protein